MEEFAPHQRGKAGDITTGVPPHDYGTAPYIEWYGHDNGRVVVEPDHMVVIGKPIAPEQCEPVSEQEQTANMAEYLGDLARDFSAVLGPQPAHLEQAGASRKAGPRLRP